VSKNSATETSEPIGTGDGETITGVHDWPSDDGLPAAGTNVGTNLEEEALGVKIPASRLGSNSA
jgi:hypothetical protein